MNALTGDCRGLCVGLGVWDAGQRDSVGGCLGIWGAWGRAQGRGVCGVVWGWAGHRGDAGRGLGACRAGQGRGQRDRGGQCARLDSEAGIKLGALEGVKDRAIYPHVCIGHIIPSRSYTVLGAISTPS